jgi:uncharacterized cupin superfamily protein
MTTTLSIPVAHVETTAWEPFLVNGQPFGDVHWLRTTAAGEGQLFTGLWRHPAGEFDYQFPGDETFHMLAGLVRIAVDGAAVVELKPGDVVSFPKGAQSHWTILEPMKKFFVISG